MYNIQQLWIAVRSGLWFLPSVIVVASILMAFGLIEMEDGLELTFKRWPRLFGAEAEGSRGMLEAIATSMITVAGVTFSITVVALTQASSQYSPLILRNFMQDRANQIVLGVFGGIFVYCLIVLRSIRGGEEPFVPGIAVVGALLYAIVGIGVLVYFIHHIATVLQADSILAMVGRRTHAAIESLFPEELGEGADETGGQREVRSDALDGLDWRPVEPHETGFIQAVRSEQLLKIACEIDGVIRMERGIGDFAIRGVPVASVACGRVLDKKAIAALQECFIIGEHRTIDQDAAFGVRQMVDMAVKALSPGINDPTTACACLDHISAIMVRLAPLRLTTPERFADGELRVLAIGPSFKSLADLAFDQIRQNAPGDTVLLHRMIAAIEVPARRTRDAQRRQVLLGHLALVRDHAIRVLESDDDKREITRRAGEALRAISGSFDGHGRGLAPAAAGP